LDNFLTFLAQFPDLRVVVDHCMKPQIREHANNPKMFQDWADGMSRLADQTHAFCKLSGLVTEAPQHWAIGDLRPSVQHVLNAFGAARVMWGSDWPVCQLHSSYAFGAKWPKTLRHI